MVNWPRKHGNRVCKSIAIISSNFLVIGRSEKSKKIFLNKTNIKVQEYNLDYCLNNLEIPEKAIICSDIINGSKIAIKLIEKGSKIFTREARMY